MIHFAWLIWNGWWNTAGLFLLIFVLLLINEFSFQVGVFVKACKDQIDILKNRIHAEENNGNSKTWLHIRDDTSHADMVAHKHGVV